LIVQLFLNDIEQLKCITGEAAVQTKVEGDKEIEVLCSDLIPVILKVNKKKIKTIN